MKHFQKWLYSLTSFDLSTNKFYTRLQREMRYFRNIHCAAFAPLVRCTWDGLSSAPLSGPVLNQMEWPKREGHERRKEGTNTWLN